ncbi:class III poly(R)-hydroxyalkanoic acid synthase subunit PhaC [Rubrobacter marinus]|uniref:Poly(3-hydroxyalkanoate) polymerase subunit PhaC n=1 Tax=Rubrobacter marinus TaxID=2653852 RepID=A0A6G8Q094_9ACTN|nr:class III poly(R)-hydroxyalkanoic acid synthase subunit PhaC [Rubrobacter marinus]QIN79882.1 class III poly(R)-hydroxyalkanoic acid synthase subunit PhaC [Rubrobacter marinus]
MDADGTTPPEVADKLGKYAVGARIVLGGARADTGQTPKTTVWTKNKARLYRYEPEQPKEHAVPILMVYALINKPYILDLMPGNSLIEHLLAEGFDVYLLDWGVPGDEDEGMAFEDYVLDYILPATKRVLWTSGAEGYTLFGYCMGGTMAAIYASLFPGEPLRNLVLLTTPTDFGPEGTGLLGTWTREEYLDPDLLADAFGNIPHEIVDAGMQMLRPVHNYVGTHASMWERIVEEKPMETWLAMNKWVNDGTPFPGAAFRQWIRDFYQQNKLARGELKLRGRKVDLANITCPVLNIAGEKDHICTLPQARATTDLVSSEDKEFLVLDAGHVGLMTGRGARQSLWPKVSGWLAERSA